MKLKKIKRSAGIISASSVLLMNPLLPTLSLIPTTVEAATSSTGTLVPGTSIDTDTHKYGLTTEILNHNNWGFVSKGPRAPSGPTPTWKPDNWLQMQYNTNSGDNNKTASWAIFNGAMDMTKNLTIEGGIKGEAGWFAADKSQVGDALGIILSPNTASDIANGEAGPYNGLKGLPNSLFLGRDYFYTYDNKLNVYDSNSGRQWPGSSTQVRIAATDNTGTMLTSDQGNKSTVTNTSLTDNKTNTPVSSLQISGGLTNYVPGDDITVSWTPNTSPNPISTSTTQVIGKLSLYVNNNWGNTTVTYNNVVVQKSMSIGMVSSSGGNYGDMTARLGSVDGYKGTQPVQVNYLDASTGKALNTSDKGEWKPSTIISNIGDKIGVGSTSVVNFNYQVPTTSGYKIKSIVRNTAITESSTDTNFLTVQNFAAGTANPNFIDVTYVPEVKTSFTPYYESGTPGTVTDSMDTRLAVPSDTPTTVGKASALPTLTPSTTLVYFGESAVAPTYTIPPGYELSGVIGPDGVLYSSFETAFAKNPLQMTNNNFKIVLKASNKSAISHYAFGSVPSDVTKPIIADSSFLSGLTGQPITSANVQTVIDTYKSNFPTDSYWQITGLTTPDGVVHPVSKIDEIKDIITGRLLDTSSNIYTLNLTYSGLITLTGADINFGSKPVGQKLIYSTDFPSGVQVIDTRLKPVPWKVSVAQTSPIHPLGKTVTEQDKKNILSFGTSETAKNSMVMSDGTPSYVDIYTQSSVTTPTTSTPKVTTDISTELLKNPKKSFYLEMPAENQKLGNYEGTVEWTLSATP